MGALQSRKRPLLIKETEPLLSVSGDHDKEVENADRDFSGWRHSSVVILAVTGFERLAMYGVYCNLDTFLGPSHHPALGLNAQTLFIVVLLFARLPYIGAFIAGTIADSRFGRYKVLLASLIFQFLGSVCLLVSAILEQSHNSENQRTSSSHARLVQCLVYTGLSSMAVGLSASSGTEIPLGVDQYRPGFGRSGEGPREAMVFFHRYYFVVNFVTVLSYGLLSFVQINYGFVAGLAPTCAIYLLSALTLYIFRRRLIVPKVSGSTLLASWSVVKRALKAKYKCCGKPAEDLQEGELFTSLNRMSSQTWLDRAKSGGFTERQISDVRRLGRVTVVLISLTFYMTALLQVMSAYVTQGQLMRAPMNRTYGIIIPSSMFYSIDSIAVMLFIVILYGAVYPRWMVSDINFNLGQLRQMGIGMMAGLSSLLSAFLVEFYRGEQKQIHIYMEESGVTLVVSDMSIFYQMPQYALAGLSEVLVIIPALEFAYYSSPFSMKGFAIGLVYTMIGLAGLFSSLLALAITTIDKTLYYQPTQSQQGHSHVYYYYVIIVGFVVLGIFLFSIAAKKFRQEPQRAG